MFVIFLLLNICGNTFCFPKKLEIVVEQFLVSTCVPEYFFGQLHFVFRDFHVLYFSVSYFFLFLSLIFHVVYFWHVSNVFVLCFFLIFHVVHFFVFLIFPFFVLEKVESEKSVKRGFLDNFAENHQTYDNLC